MFGNEKIHNIEVRRPLSGTLIDDGVYKGRIVATDFREMDSKFHASGKREVFSMKIEVENEDGEIVYLFYSVNYNWSLKGNFVKLLSDFDMLPDEGECLDVTDFTRWGYAIAEALGIGGEAFLDAYFSNQNKSNEEAISSHPVASAIVALMKSTTNWNGTVAELLGTLERVAEREKINTHVKVWPNAAHILSRRLKEVQSNLKQVGITFDIRHMGTAKVININRSENMTIGLNDSNTSTESLNQTTMLRRYTPEQIEDVSEDDE